jgi:hypothetical protein
LTQLRKRLTYANVMSSIAVFLVIGGATAFAALGKNTVGSKQLKKNAVTAAKIKKNAVTTDKIKDNAVNGAKVDEASLATVPNANTANSAKTATSATAANSASTAGTANALSPLEAVHLVGAPGEPPFENGATNFPIPPGTPFGFNPVGFYKDHEGIVHLQGIAKAGSSTTIASVFTLPPGFRPAAGKVIDLQPIDESTVLVFGGNVVFEGLDLSGKIIGEEEEAVVLDNITFKAES